MKRELAITGIALVVSILLSSPSVAQTLPAKTEPAAEATAPAPSEPANEISLEAMSLDDAILFASSTEDRMRLLMRCAGPPPKIATDVAVSKHLPVSPEG